MQSFSEIDTTSKRASKAAGFAWGVAEEIGKNMRNLEMFLNLRQLLKIITSQLSELILKKKIVQLIFGSYQKIKKNLE